ncbi:MAG: hypothetical protein RLZZ494_1783 [Pseudomonadota bacterium]|jgi:hypothetical protein
MLSPTLSVLRVAGRVVWLTGLLTGAAWSHAQSDIVRPKPALKLAANELSGEAAITALGRSLPAVAAAYGQTTEQFTHMLRRDPRLRVDRRGRLFAVEDIDARLAQAMAVQAAQPELAQASGTSLDLSQTFLLHSRPSAQRTIYLNFKGATLTNTAWSDGSFQAPAFSLDSDLSDFSSREQQMIQGIWRRVAEDYAPFDVDVTTEAPSNARLNRSSSSDAIYGTTVLITRNEGLYNCSCGGVSYIGVFNDVGNYYKPALVFYNQLSGEKNLAEAVSHEAGHNLGLHHDGDGQVSYYEGHGSGATGWASIMGAGYYQRVTQWSKGEYENANNQEDDLAIISRYGLPRRTDDHGNTIGTATPLTVATGNATTLTGNGVIERATDIDMFSFSASAGDLLALTVAPETYAPNLDVYIRLLDADRQVIAQAKPGSQLSAGLKLTLPTAGTYYVAVRNSGYGDPLTNGYSTYGSLGQYTVRATLTTP